MNGIKLEANGFTGLVIRYVYRDQEYAYSTDFTSGRSRITSEEIARFRGTVQATLMSSGIMPSNQGNESNDDTISKEK